MLNLNLTVAFSNVCQQNALNVVRYSEINGPPSVDVVTVRSTTSDREAGDFRIGVAVDSKT